MKIESLDQAKTFLEFGLGYLDSVSDSDVADFEAFKSGFLERIASAGFKNGQVLWPIRVALSGEEFSPGAFELTKLLGLDLSRQRVRRMLEKIAVSS